MLHQKPDDEKPRVPAWWLDGTGPLTMGLAAAVGTALTAATHRGTAAPDWLGTLVLIALAANAVAIDNVRGTPGARGKIAAATLAIGVALAAAGAAFL